MNGIAVLVALAAAGVDYGWQPTADGQLEYIIQIDPGLLEGMRQGDEIVSEILPQARGVRKFRIRVGKGQLPRIGHLQSNTAPRSFTTPDPDATGLTTPGGGPQNNWGTPPSAGGGPMGSEFRPDGLLNLPPPPPLLGADGKSSVLVRPGAMASPAATGGSVSEILPPSDVTTEAPRGTLGLGDPPAPSNATDSRGWEPPPVTRPSNSLPPGGGVFPPSSGSSFPAAPSDGLVLPPTDVDATPSADEHPVRPVPSPNSDSGAPYPIRVGDSGMLPPVSDNTFTRGPTRPDSSSNGSAGADTETMSKPTIDAETASKLQPPWKPLVFTSLALFASLAANLYLGWVALGIYRRYRDMVEQLHQTQASLT